MLHPKQTAAKYSTERMGDIRVILTAAAPGKQAYVTTIFSDIVVSINCGFSAARLEPQHVRPFLVCDDRLEPSAPKVECGALFEIVAVPVVHGCHARFDVIESRLSSNSASGTT